MKATTKAKWLLTWGTIQIWAYVAVLVALCLLGMFAALIGWRRLDDWCAKQTE